MSTKTLFVLFDSGPSSHKDGIYRDLRSNGNLIIVHCLEGTKIPDHPSASISEEKQIADHIFFINIDGNTLCNSVFAISASIKTEGLSSARCILIFAFVSLRKLLFVRKFFNKILYLNSFTSVEYYAHYEPLRLNDTNACARVVRFLFSVTLQKAFFKPLGLWYISTLNLWLYSLFYQPRICMPYKSCKLPFLSNRPTIYNPHSYRIVYVGQLIARKNVELILRSLKYIKQPVHLDIYGSGPCEAFLKTMAASSCLSHHLISFCGHVSNEQVRRVLLNYDNLVLPSHFDGYGFVVREAYDVNLRSIVSSQCGALDLITHAGGRIFRSNSERQLAASIILEMLRKQSTLQSL